MRPALTWAASQGKVLLGSRERSILTLQPSRAEHPLTARIGVSSDMIVFHQVFGLEEYKSLRSISSPKLILDLGAYAGFSSAYFLSCFPSAKVIAVEPDPGNFECCKRNLAPYGERVRLINGAVWSSRSRLDLETFGDDCEYGTQVHLSVNPEDAGTVDAWDIPSLLELAGASEIDLLKIDIEGSEVEIFGAGSESWLRNVRNLCIELHGPECERVFYEALKDFEYDCEHRGELVICRNLRAKKLANVPGLTPQ